MKSEPIQTNDPSLTAFALGELSPAELFQFEQQLKDSPAAQAELVEITETIGWLNDGFSSELQTPRLAIEPVVTHEDKVVAGNFKRPGMKVMLSGLAAVLAGLAAVGALITKDRADFQNNQVLAQTNAPRVESIESFHPATSAPQTASIVQVGYTPGVEPTFVALHGNGYDQVDGMMVPKIAPTNALLDYSKLPDIVTIAAANEVKAQYGGDLNSYISYKNLSPTPILEINSNNVANGEQLPGIDAIGKGKASYGTYKFQNEASKNLSDEEFGHGKLAFEIRSRIVDGKLVEIVRLVDTRITPDGKETKTVKEFVREGADVGKSIESLLPQLQNASASKTLAPTNASAVNVPTVGAVTALPVNPLVTEFFMINSELTSVRDALALSPAGADLKALENKLSKLIERQAILGQKMERGLGGM